MKTKNLLFRLLCIIIAFCVLVCSCCAAAFAVDTPYEDSRFFTMGDYEIHYRVIAHKGDFKGRIMMLHGFLCSTYAWRNMADGLSEAGYDCVLADLPNFGFSTRETADTEIIDREILIEELMDFLAPNGDWILAGHSMGGCVAVNIAQEYDIKALLLFCPAVQSTAPEALGPLVTSAPMSFLMNTFFKYGVRLTPVVRLLIYAATRNCEFSKSYDVTGVTAPFEYEGIGAGLCRMITTVRPTALESASEITAPVLLVEADGDIIISADMKEQYLAAFPNAQTYIVKGGGHQCIEDRAGELVPLAVDFLE